MLTYIINMTRSFVFFIFENKKKYFKYLVVLFIFITLVTGIFTYKGIFDIIPIANAILSILNVSQKDIKRIKIGQIIISILWIVYDIRIYSYIASVTEMIIILSAMKSLNSNPKLLCEKT